MDPLLRRGALWFAATAVARSTLPDGAARRALPGWGAAATVVPLAAPSLLLSELPLQAAALEVAHLLAARGDGKGWSRVLGAALGGASLVGLAQAHRDAARAEEVLTAALEEAIGLAALPPVQPGAAVTRRRMLLPRFTERSAYLSAADLRYGDHPRRNVLDIWRREDLPLDASAPVIVQIHGSAWVRGSKRGQGYPLLTHLARQGWIGVAINYALAPEQRWPAHVVDVKRSLAWVKENIPQHGGDPSFIALTGGSAGGHLTALAALSSGAADFQPGFEDADTRVAAAVPLYGVYDFLDRFDDSPREQRSFLERFVMPATFDEDPDIYDRASPLSWLRTDAPPFFVLHGANDTLTSPRQARRFADELRKVSSSPVAYAELPGAQHLWDALPSLRTALTVRAVERFLLSVRGGCDLPSAALIT